MSGSLNRVTLIGNLGRDPEVKSFQNGGRVCNFTMATTESWRDKTSGERKEKTEWHRVVIFSEGLVGVAERFLRKGSKVYVEGQLESRKFQDQSGNERSITEVVMRNFNSNLVMLDGKNAESGQSQPANNAYQDRRDGKTPEPQGGGDSGDWGDTIPFAPEKLA